MAKTSKSSAVNPRSRAAKRATSPSIDVDRSIKHVPRAMGTSPMLGVSHKSGVTKKRKVKQMTRGQRARQEKGLARAEIVIDQLEKKVEGAKGKQKKRHLRKALWNDVNDSTQDEQRKAIKAPGRGGIIEDTEGQDNEDIQDNSDIEMGQTKSFGPQMEPRIMQHAHIAPDEIDDSTVHHKDETDLIT